MGLMQSDYVNTVLEACPNYCDKGLCYKGCVGKNVELVYAVPVEVEHLVSRTICACDQSIVSPPILVIPL